MDEYKIRDAINTLRGIGSNTEACELAIKALERQLPKKPVIKAKEEVPHTHDLGKLLHFYCPNCGRFIVAMYEKDCGISDSLKGCSSCLQAIDFSEYYPKRENDKLDEWSD